MSFSSEVKEELAKQFGRSRHCQIAELAGILELEGMLDEEGKLSPVKASDLRPDSASRAEPAASAAASPAASDDFGDVPF